MEKDDAQGLYHKYTVERVNPEAQARHRTCSHFVLDLDCDPHALPAIMAYADSAVAEHPQLADDLRWYMNRVVKKRLIEQGKRA